MRWRCGHSRPQANRLYRGLNELWEMTVHAPGMFKLPTWGRMGMTAGNRSQGQLDLGLERQARKYVKGQRGT